ncbi:hypothetical protein K435DRAFT_383668 [Dendrothele bispora CBS 962.96]|uniref:Uncharacterized protein n=1 Tax=Dendrothele bispora (strain CBS 962.96) TaxID=1314807 RepID=A0A4S8MI43_DENBC|nr:hypothetical protein K435DRAFT_383668 [Dendrothele bispora CBS 962.96]
MQSHLLGVPEIFIGYRNDDHDIVRTEIVYTEDIKPKKFEDDIERGYRVLSSLRERLSTEQQGDGMKVSDKSDSDLQNAMIGLNLSLNRPRHEPGDTTRDTGRLTSDDCIWKVTIKKWSFDAVERLNAADAQNVKKRREDPSRPIERIGIIPEAFVDAIRASVKGDVN